MCKWPNVKNNLIEGDQSFFLKKGLKIHVKWDIIWRHSKTYRHALMHRWLMSRNCPAQEATPGRPCFSCHPSCLPVGWQASMSAVSILEGQVKCFSTLAPHYRIIKVLETHTRRSWFHWTEALTLKLFKNILVLLMWIQGERARGMLFAPY